MMSNAKHNSGLPLAVGVGLVLSLLLTAFQQVLAGSYSRNAAESYADTWTCNYYDGRHNPN